MPEPLDVGPHHHLDEPGERHAGRPAERLARSRRPEVIHLRGADERRVGDDVIAPAETDTVECDLDELPDGMRAPGRDDGIPRRSLLEHAVTNSRPPRGLSWLKRIPEQAKS